MFVGFGVGLLVADVSSKTMRGVIAGSIFVFLLGLVDDIFQLKPFPKLIGIILACGAVLWSGLYLPWFSWMPLNVAVTILWLVGITNAMNLLDNMDGLAAGIGVIASIFVGLSFFLEGKSPEVTVAAVFGVAVLGFVVYNFYPASIFMGDCGSMFLGFFLASLTLMSGFGRSRNVLYVLAGPVLPFLMPIFDTTFVTISRLASGRRVSSGGRDHTSHRLASVAGSERNAVLILYAFAVLSGLLSVLVRLGYFSVSFALIPTLCLFLALFGWYLGQVRVSVAAGTRSVWLVSRLESLILHNGIVQIILDSVLIILAYYTALLLRFEGDIPSGDMKMFFETIPWFIVIKVSVFTALGGYRHIWRYFGMDSLLVYTKAITISSGICILVLVLVTRFDGFSRAVFFMDAILLLCLITATRMSSAIFKVALKRTSVAQNGLQRALIYGADEMGHLLARQLQDRVTLGYVAVGFIDDDPAKQSRSLNGYKIFSATAELQTALRTESVNVVLLTANDISSERLDNLRNLCLQFRIPVRQISIRIE
jgi:UDP-GlcNAc:undecaprenyl-phosphate/decaprenyl-phosphate GlcNAc-1-phosphate transferase